MKYIKTLIIYFFTFIIIIKMCRNCFKKDEEIDDEHSDLVRKRKKMQKILGKNFES